MLWIMEALVSEPKHSFCMSGFDIEQEHHSTHATSQSLFIQSHAITAHSVVFMDLDLAGLKGTT